MFSLESPHSCNEYTQYTIINIKKEITLKYAEYNNVCSYGIFPRDSRAVVGMIGRCDGPGYTSNAGAS